MTYFLKIKYTARIRNTKPTRWLRVKGWSLKKMSMNTVKMVSERNSWMTLSCQRLNGPPFSMKPMRFAGTMKLYSINAIPQLKRMTNGSESLLNQAVLCNFK